MAKSKTPSAQKQMPVAQPEGDVIAFRVQLPSPVTVVAEKAFKDAETAVIGNVEDYTAAADFRTKVMQLRDSYEQQRVEMKNPSLEAGRKVDAFWQPAIKLLDKAAGQLRDKLVAWDDHQRRIAEEKARKEREEAQRIAREKEQRMRDAMGEIQGIQHQVMIASVGRAGVRKGGTLECIDETLKETEAWNVSEDRFGEWHEAARKAKDAAIAAIKNLREQFIQTQQANAEKEKAQRTAAEERAARVAAEKERMKAENAAREAADAANKALQQSQREVAELEHKAETTQVEDTRVQVSGMTHVTEWKWKLVDKTKINPDFLIVDEKAINALVRTQKKRAESVVGGIEVFETKNLRQQR